MNATIKIQYNVIFFFPKEFKNHLNGKLNRTQLSLVKVFRKQIMNKQFSPTSALWGNTICLLKHYKVLNVIQLNHSLQRTIIKKKNPKPKTILWKESLFGHSDFFPFNFNV